MSGGLLYPYKSHPDTLELFHNQEQFLRRNNPGASFVPAPHHIDVHCTTIQPEPNIPFSNGRNKDQIHQLSQYRHLIRDRILSGLQDNRRCGLTFGSEKEFHIVTADLEPGSCSTLFEDMIQIDNAEHPVHGDGNIPIEIQYLDLSQNGFVPSIKPDGGAHMLEIASAPHTDIESIWKELRIIYSRIRTSMSRTGLNILCTAKHPFYHMLPWAPGKHRYPEIVRGLGSLGYSLYPASTHTSEQATFGLEDEDSFLKSIATLGWVGVYMTPLFSNSLDVDQQGNSSLDDRALMWNQCGSERTGLVPYFYSIDDLISWWFSRKCILYLDQNRELTANTEKSSFSDILISQKDFIDADRLFDLLAWHIGTIWSDTRAKINGLVEFRTPSSGNPADGEPMLAFSIGIMKNLKKVFDFLYYQIGERTIQSDRLTVMMAKQNYTDRIWEISSKLLELASEGLRNSGFGDEHLEIYKRRISNKLSPAMEQLLALQEASRSNDLTLYLNWLCNNRLHKV